VGFRSNWDSIGGLWFGGVKRLLVGLTPNGGLEKSQFSSFFVSILFSGRSRMPSSVVKRTRYVDELRGLPTSHNFMFTICLHRTQALINGIIRCLLDPSYCLLSCPARSIKFIFNYVACWQEAYRQAVRGNRRR
jgi:hypothetical protein